MYVWGRREAQLGLMFTILVLVGMAALGGSSFPWSFSTVVASEKNSLTLEQYKSFSIQGSFATCTLVESKINTCTTTAYDVAGLDACAFGSRVAKASLWTCMALLLMSLAGLTLDSKRMQPCAKAFSAVSALALLGLTATSAALWEMQCVPELAEWVKESSAGKSVVAHGAGWILAVVAACLSIPLMLLSVLRVKNTNAYTVKRIDDKQSDSDTDEDEDEV